MLAILGYAVVGVVAWCIMVCLLEDTHEIFALVVATVVAILVVMGVRQMVLEDKAEHTMHVHAAFHVAQLTPTAETREQEACKRAGMDHAVWVRASNAVTGHAHSKAIDVFACVDDRGLVHAAEPPFCNTRNLVVPNDAVGTQAFYERCRASYVEQPTKN